MTCLPWSAFPYSPKRARAWKGTDLYSAETAQTINAAGLAGVGMVLHKAPDNSLFVRRVIQDSPAERSGIRAGDCLFEVDGVTQYCKGIAAATAAILGPVGSVVRVKLVRVEGAKRVPVEVLLVRELKATEQAQFSVREGGNKCTTSYLHLECMQTSRDETLPATPEKPRTVLSDVNTCRAASDVDMLEAAAADLSCPACEISPACDDAPASAPRALSPQESASLDWALLGGELRPRGASMGRRRKAVAARVSRRGATLLLHLGQVSWEVVQVKGAGTYSPHMSKAEFAALDVALSVLVLGASDAVVHSSAGAVAAVARHELHFTATSPEDRTRWVAGISAGLATLRPTPAAPPPPSVVPAATPHHPHVSVDLAAANKAANKETRTASGGKVARGTRAVALDARGTSPPTARGFEDIEALPLGSAGSAGSADRKEHAAASELHAVAAVSLAVPAARASREEEREAAVRGAMAVHLQVTGGSVDAAACARTVAGDAREAPVKSLGGDHVQCLVQPPAHHVPSLVQPPAHTVVDTDVEKEEEDGSERWSGLAVSRIACFEERRGTAVAREAGWARDAGDAGAVDLEKQWARSVERFAGQPGGIQVESGAGLSGAGSKAGGGKCGSKVASLGNKVG
eukprot:CAMPEP_0180284180 /NCGR_PEP_ID=MMETSP0988-20121125/11002_1 /TAXON_ID=697907 /ORGANISM="non described non described, Strain CCMP2293" /LENGTH=632 /DNA_ID=CAMNT_0022257023 /DNA_START=22 /DNA_END=1917 /DNA_ORIENTATION=-